MNKPLICFIHHSKPANKMCHICKRGFCKYDDLKHDGQGYICGTCDKTQLPVKSMKIL